MRRSRRVTAVACAAAVFAASTAAAQQNSRAVFLSQVDSLARDALKTLGASSVSVAVAQGSDAIVARAYGVADRENKIPADANTVYEIGSLTKQFTAAAIMRLEAAGKLGVDDDISRYVPGFPLQGHRVSIRNLLNHTSGIHNYTAKPGWRAHWKEDLSPDSIIGFVARDTFDFAPGTAQRYSNTGYVLLGMIIERASGRSYAEYLESEFFKPLGLSRTHYCTQHSADPGIAKGYSDKNGALVPAEYLSMTHPFAAGAICSTPRDIAKWEVAFHQGGVLSPSAYKRMTAATTLGSGRIVNYGFGLSLITLDVEKLGSFRTIGHNGGINGFLSEQIYVPSDSLAVVVLTNSDVKPPDGLAVDIVTAALKWRHKQ
ncbi:MAG TPA: serine hydrolase domain-containing protein [Gemmatimonadaceae bacterium]|nr:serine hydrolase domain-containing protein [Gemmatimonadaceae bacterium]